MTAKKVVHVLSDEEQIVAIAKRIKRAQGQLGAVARMLEEGRNCDGKNNSDAVTAQLQKLFLTLA
jgi:DNA-binding FrmR family transcriptional regulator